MQTPDVYEYLSTFTDDKDVLNMLSVNKKFNNPVFFERALKRRYPFLLKYKTENSSWRSFYVSMIYYISKMKELFPVYNDTFDPETVPKEMLKKYLNNYYFSKNKLSISHDFINLLVKLVRQNEDLFIGGFNSPSFLKKPMIDFLKHIFPNLQELIEPFLKEDLLSRSLLSLIFSQYFLSNNLKFDEDGKRYFYTNPEMGRYLGPYLDKLEEDDRLENGMDARGKRKMKFNRNKFQFNRIQSIINQGIKTYSEMTDEQRDLTRHNRIRIANLAEVSELLNY
jgi:hypothetical protein